MQKLKMVSRSYIPLENIATKISETIFFEREYIQDVEVEDKYFKYTIVKEGIYYYLTIEAKGDHGYWWFGKALSKLMYGSKKSTYKKFPVKIDGLVTTDIEHALLIAIMTSIDKTQARICMDMISDGKL